MANIEYIYNNFPIAHIKGGITAVATVLELYPGEAQTFLPGWSSGTEFICTIYDYQGNREVVKVTDIAEDIFTIERNQDGNGAFAFASGANITQRVEKNQLESFKIGRAHV